MTQFGVINCNGSFISSCFKPFNYDKQVNVMTAATIIRRRAETRNGYTANTMPRLTGTIMTAANDSCLQRGSMSVQTQKTQNGPQSPQGF